MWSVSVSPGRGFEEIGSLFYADGDHVWWKTESGYAQTGGETTDRLDFIDFASSGEGAVQLVRTRDPRLCMASIVDPGRDGQSLILLLMLHLYCKAAFTLLQ